MIHVRQRWLLIPLFALAAAGCRTLGPEPAAMPAVVEPRGEPVDTAASEPWLVQVIHRRARSRAGELGHAAAAALVTEAFGFFGETPYPFEAMAALVPPAGELAIAAPSPRGVVCRELLSRLSIAVEEPQRMRELEWPLPPAAGLDIGEVFAVVQPRWSDGRVLAGARQLSSELGQAGYPHPRVVLADLAAPRIDGSVWEADMVLLGHREAVVFATRLVLEARATGKIPDPERIGKELGIDPSRITWERELIVR